MRYAGTGEEGGRLPKDNVHMEPYDPYQEQRLLEEDDEEETVKAAACTGEELLLSSD